MQRKMKTGSFGGQIIRKGDLKYALAATDSFVAEVGPDEIFEVETELNIAGISFTRSVRSLIMPTLRCPSSTQRPDRFAFAVRSRATC